jgi:hypothetical protein
VKEWTGRVPENRLYQQYLAAAIVRKFGVDFQAEPAQMRINGRTRDQSGVRMPGHKQKQKQKSPRLSSKGFLLRFFGNQRIWWVVQGLNL